MIAPSLVLGFCLSTLYGLVFFLIVGHGWPRFFFCWAAGVAGFFVGQSVAHLIGLAIFNLGDLNLVEGTVGSWVGLLAARAWRP